MFGKGKREREHLERNGVRAPATVLEIARLGWNIGDGGPNITSSSSEAVRMTTLRVEPEGGAPFEVRKRLRYGHGRYLPEAGDRIEVLYDPSDHEAVMVAPPTAEEDALRAAKALSKAKIGFTIGGDKEPSQVTDAFMQEHQEALKQAQEAQKLMEQYSGGGETTTPEEGAFDTSMQLAQLEALRDGGAMSEEDFQAAKARLLGEG
jgi:hypothetical protein